jgi:hypothetical protein
MTVRLAVSDRALICAKEKATMPELGENQVMSSILPPANDTGEKDQGDDEGHIGGDTAGGIATIGFDYSTVSDDTAEQMRAAAERVHKLNQIAHDSGISVGRELLAVKDRVAHGQFEDWVEHECQMPMRTAQRMMLAAEMVGKNDKLSYLPQDGLVALGSRSAPTPVIKEIIGRIEAGEKPSTAEIKEQIAKAKVQMRRPAGAGTLTAKQRQRAEQEVGEAAAADAAAQMLIPRLGERLAEFVPLLEKAGSRRIGELLRRHMARAAEEADHAMAVRLQADLALDDVIAVPEEVEAPATIEAEIAGIELGRLPAQLPRGLSVLGIDPTEEKAGLLFERG